jgi:hypothetical protein
MLAQAMAGDVIRGSQVAKSRLSWLVTKTCFEPGCSEPGCSEPGCSEPGCSEPGAIRAVNIDRLGWEW